MFHKPFRVKSQSQLKGSEKKKFATETAQHFPSLSDDDLSSLFPPKADVSITKAICFKGETVHIYQVQKEPLFFKIDKSGKLLPTVYFLWRFPFSIKTFTTYSNVVDKLRQGADLMLPGIIVKGDVTLRTYGRFEKGKVVVVNTDKNTSPFALGRTALSSYDMYMSARQGKGVIILHVYMDYLWEMGTKTVITHLSPSARRRILVDTSASEEIEEKFDANTVTEAIGEVSISEEPNGVNAPNQDTSKTISGSEAMDELFYYCFLKALKTTAKKTDLPVLTSNFYRLHMVTACPHYKVLDVKKSTYKKISKFLNAMTKKNLIEVKEFPKGVENITAINFAHEDIKSFVIDVNDDIPVNESKGPQSQNSFIPPVLEEVYQVSGSTLQFFKRNGLSKGDVLSRSEVRLVVTAYIEKMNLKKADKVEVDPLLHEAVVSPKEGYKEFLRWDEIFSRLLGKMSPAVRITRQGYVPIVRKGKLEPIEIAVAKRSGNKKVTLVYNVGYFGIDENEFAHQVQIGVATSTSVGAAENKPQGMVQILVQGNQVLFIGKLLLETYNLPRKYIKGLELAPKGKK